jgi:hypothetical protein
MRKPIKESGKRKDNNSKNDYNYSRSLIEANIDPLVTISPDGVITDVNEATIKGCFSGKAYWNRFFGLFYRS